MTDSVRTYRYKRVVGGPMWPPEFKLDNADKPCPNCQKLVGEHSAEEFDVCMEKWVEKNGGWRMHEPPKP